MKNIEVISPVIKELIILKKKILYAAMNLKTFPTKTWVKNNVFLFLFLISFLNWKMTIGSPSRICTTWKTPDFISYVLVFFGNWKSSIRLSLKIFSFYMQISTDGKWLFNQDGERGLSVWAFLAELHYSVHHLICTYSSKMVALNRRSINRWEIDVPSGIASSAVSLSINL